MKIEPNKEIIFEKTYYKKENHCESKVSFSDYLEKSIEKKDEEEKTSIFAEKRTEKRKLDIFDTLIDI